MKFHQFTESDSNLRVETLNSVIERIDRHRTGLSQNQQHIPACIPLAEKQVP